MRGLFSQLFRLFALLLLPVSIFLPLIQDRTSAAEPWFAGNPSFLDITKPLPASEYTEIKDEQNALLGKLDCFNRRIARRAFGSLSIQYEDGCWYQTRIGLLSASGDYLLQPGTEVAGKFDFSQVDSGSAKHHILPTPNEDVFLDVIEDGATGYGFNIGFRHIDSMTLTRINNVTGTVTLALSESVSYRPRAGSSTGSMINTASGAISWSPDGKYMLLWKDRGSVYRFNLETFQTLAARVWQYGGSPSRGTVAISPSGKFGAATKEQSPASSNMYIIDFDSCADSEEEYFTIDIGCKVKDLRSLLLASVPEFRAPSVPRFYGENTLGFYHRPGTSGNYTQYFLQAAGTEFVSSGYLALGDSFSSGEGAGDYIAGTDEQFGNTCHTSENSYPYLINKVLNLADFSSLACSGAKIEHMTTQGKFPDDDDRPGSKKQLHYVDTASYGVVTVTISGNDIGFGDKIIKCLYADTCFSSYEERVQIANEIIRQHDKLVNDVYERIMDRQVNAKLYVIGYPKLFNDSSSAACGINVRFNIYQRKMANDLVEYFNAILKHASDSIGAYFVNTTDALHGSRLCDGDILAVNGLTIGNDSFGGVGPFSLGSYHPNALGHNLMKAAILQETDNFTKVTPLPAASPMPNIDDFAFGQAPKIGATIRKLYKNSQDPIISNSGDKITLRVDGFDIPLDSLSSYDIYLHSTPTHLGRATSDIVGHLELELVIPHDTATGVHELHVQGNDKEGHPIDVYQLVYVGNVVDDLKVDDTTPLTGQTPQTTPVDGIPDNQQAIPDGATVPQQVVWPGESGDENTAKTPRAGDVLSSRTLNGLSADANVSSGRWTYAVFVPITLVLVVIFRKLLGKRQSS